MLPQAIPQITSRFHSLHDVGWYGSSYLLASAALQPLTGKIYSLFNTKWTFICFFAVFEFGSLLSAVATSSTMLIIGRAVAGMGASGLINGGMQIIYQAVPDQKRAQTMGILMVQSQLGLVGGPVLGGVLTEFASWRWCFYINLPIGAIAIGCLALVNVPDRLHRPTLEKDGKSQSKIKAMIHALDLKGFVLFSGCSIMLVLALQWGGVEYKWISGRILGLFFGSLGLFIIFCFQEYRIGDRAMFPWSVVRRMSVWTAGLSMFLFFGSQMIGNYYLPIYFQTVRNASPAMSGVMILPSIGGTMLFGLVSGFAVSKTGHYIPWMMFSGVFAGVGNGLLSTLNVDSPAIKWVWFQLIAGFGRGAGMQMVSSRLCPATDSC
jgi:MFS family permease